MQLSDKAHRVYIKVLRKMTPEQKLKKSFELGLMSRALFEKGMRKRFPDKSEKEMRKFILERLDKCHNRNY